MNTPISHDHVGISVTPEDLDATAEWYADTFGFAVEQRFESHGITFVYLVSGTVKIELLAGASTREAPADTLLSSMDPQRLHHFCIAVADLDAALARLRGLGVEPIGDVMAVAAIGRRIAFITDNVGTVIELTEPGTRRAHPGRDG